MADEVKRRHLRLAWIALACLVVPMFASYYFDDMFSSISYLFENPSLTALGWDSKGYGLYAGGYSVLCVFGGLVVCGILLDKWGVRITGSIFVGMMVLGAGIVTLALLSGKPWSLQAAYAGCMLFGLGSEIAGTAVTRSIARWFKGGPMALAMGLQLAIARLGTAFALVLSPKLVAQQTGHVYSLAETARPALVGMGLMALGLILWAFFVAMDARRFPKKAALSDSAAGTADGQESASDDETFRFKDVLKVLGNKNFWLLGLLCVLFYSSIIAFKKFAGAILIPRFGIPAGTAGWMVSMLPFSTVIPLDGDRLRAGADRPSASRLRPRRSAVLGLSRDGVPGIRLFARPRGLVAQRAQDRAGQGAGYHFRAHLLGAESRPDDLQDAVREHPGQRGERSGGRGADVHRPLHRRRDHRPALRPHLGPSPGTRPGQTEQGVAFLLIAYPGR